MMKRALLVLACVSLAVCNGVLTGSKWQGVREELPLRRLRLNALKASVPAAPAASGSGIVMVAENLGDVATAYQTLAHLRESGVAAPAELWIADADITPAATAEFASLSVSLRDLSSVASAEQLAVRDGKRPQALAVAVAHSAFETVLYLDVANAATDADTLLAHPALASSGLVFWPTQEKTSAENPIWELVGAARAHADSYQQGVAQMLVSKNKAWSALHLVSHLTTPFYGLMLNGNVDAVRMAALAARAEFLMETEPAAAAVVPASTRALPAAIQDFAAMQTCTTLTTTQIRDYASLNSINIEGEFGGRLNGTKKTFNYPRAQQRSACKVFARGGMCDGTTITQDKNLEVAFIRILMGGKDARLRFRHRGTNGQGLYQNYSIIQAGTWDSSDYWCDARGSFYTVVEKNDGEPTGDFLLMAAYDLARPDDRFYPTGKLDRHYIEIEWNAGVLARPSFWLMALAFALAAAMRFPY